LLPYCELPVRLALHLFFTCGKVAKASLVLPRPVFAIIAFIATII
jgi:hypothetical protein